MKKNNYARQIGFTLIELVVAITIGLLVVGFGSLSLNNFYEKQKVGSTRQELLSNLILARNYAITNQLPTGGNRVVVTIDGNGLMVIKTQDINNNDIGSSFFQKNVTKKGVNITIDNIIKFSVTDGRLIGTTAVNIGVSGTNLVENIRIDESGLIYEQ